MEIYSVMKDWQNLIHLRYFITTTVNLLAINYIILKVLNNGMTQKHTRLEITVFLPNKYSNNIY